jgi:lipoyl-dependent peroxiredoxin
MASLSIQFNSLEDVMAIRTADAEWRGSLTQGSGHMRLGSDAFEGPYDFRSRMGEGKGTNPEELLGAAHAGCFSMALALQLADAGFTVERIHTTAKVHFEERDGGWSIQRVDLDTEASVSDVAAGIFEEYAQGAKKNCPISRALSGVDIHLLAKLL